LKATSPERPTTAFGREWVLGLTKRNAFRGGELLDIKLKGNYEWQTGHQAEGT
jgi:hypothetical protein